MRRGRGSELRILPALAGFASLIAVWQFAVAIGDANPLLLPPPADVLRTGIDLATSGSLWRDVSQSLGRVLAGFTIGAVVGVLLAIMFTMVKVASRMYRPVLETLRPIPGIAWIPLAILWFGIGTPSALFIVAIGGFFPVFVNTLSGFKSVSERYLELAQSLGASRSMILFEVLIPGALPVILTGIRVGIGVSWMTVIAAELIATRSGLGYMIQLNRSLLRTPDVIVGMVLIGLIGAGMSMFVEALERRLVPWHGR